MPTENATLGPLDPIMRELGFQANEPIHDWAPVDMKQVQQSLFASFYDEPQHIVLRPDEVIEDPIALPVVITEAKAVYQSYNPLLTPSTPTGCWRRPSWLVHGWIVPSGFDPYFHPVQIRLYQHMVVSGPPDGTYWQVVSDRPSENDELTVVTD